MRHALSPPPRYNSQMTFAPRPHFDWRLRTRTLALGERSLIMAIVNLTPDSFSGDGVARQGTGQTTASTAFDALSPTTTSQDLIVRGASSNGRLAVGSNGNVLTVVGGNVTWAAPAASGSVTSVGLSAPSQFTVTGSPVTTSGTLTFAWNAQAINTVLAGPSSGSSAAPTFRSLVSADIPALDFAKITTGVVPIVQGGTGQTTANAAYNALSPMTTNGDIEIRSGGVAARLAIGSSGQVLTVVSGLPAWASQAASGTVTSVGLSMPSDFTVTNSPVTSSGTLTATWNTKAANTFLAGPASGSAATPAFRALVTSDVPWPSDYISGLKLIWNSVNSISIGTGEAVIPSTGKLETVSSLLTLSSISLGASTFGHVYLFDASGTPSIECNTTAPATAYQGSARAKTGDTTRRYLGSVLTDSSGNIYNFVHSDTKITYLNAATGASPFRVLAGGNATTSTAISLAGILRSTATRVDIKVTNQSTTGNIMVQSIVGSGAGIGTVPPTLTSFNYVVNFDIPCPSLGIAYTNGAALGNTTIDVFGYTFER